MPLFISYDAAPPISIVHAAPGAQVHLNSSFANFLEFQRTGFLTRGAIGALGSFEMNMSWNMEYSGPMHRLYDKSKPAYWTALGETGYHLQYAPATNTNGDVWDAGGNQIAYSFSINEAKFNKDVKVGGKLHIDRAAGRVLAAAGQAALVVTNDRCEQGDAVLANLATNDATAFIRSVVPADGYFTVHMIPPTGPVSISYACVGT
jgi:hypothetical protein